MKPSEVLRRAKALITNPEHWTQKVYARDIAGFPVGPSESRAVSWCATGALHKVNAGWASTRIPLPSDYDYLNQAAPCGFPEYINDFGGHAAVMALYDRAIELAIANGD